MTRLQQRPLLGFLVDPFEKYASAMELDGNNIRITQRGQIASLPFQALTHAPALRKGMLGTALTINSHERANVTLKAASHIAATGFAEKVKEAWTRFNLAALEKEGARLDRVLAGVRVLAAPPRYPSACRVAPLLNDACQFDTSILSKLNAEAIGPEVVARIAPVRKFAADPRTARANAIAAFVTAELDRWKDFFDTIESKALTQEQRLSVVVDEDATLVLAGAGSGKTSVITAKAAYLVKAGIRQPEEILLLAFAKNAAEEMSERVEARSGVPIVARTFHAIAYDIIGIVEGSKPALADHATDDMAFSNLIKQILKDLVYRLSEVSKAIIQFFAHFLVEPKTEWDFKTKDPFAGHVFVFRGRRGDLVKVIWWDGQEACMFLKQLDKSRFVLPSTKEGTSRVHAGESRANLFPASDPFPTPLLGDGGLIAVRDFRFPGTGRIADAAEELSETAAAFDQPAIFAFRASRITGTATTSNLARPLGKAWQGRTAGRTGRQKIPAMLNMLAAIPDAAILPGQT